ncbi:PREDICTED: uncharacterized protein LOC104708712 isoform X2 [Camelina sativa]|uniref:DNA topoisomerase 2 n=1 Tax=Camelina sativa TaxID=90675 RepID=A0ABM0TBA2_CAMSA|nr:PREDICTED: uncharacterized protein LOC104708712 isoform X2 [Camelina sativa]XP_010423632.1 PREDICTED: uncharacterized protein LOC104708712 isoform X2 [Camelina sativa]XP_019084529.1 PREDICTED: uncharacterized protein LOC104708712 isoform X2 [Camelina sativa]
MYCGAVKRVSLQSIKLVMVSLEMEDNDPNKECIYADSLSEFITWINSDKTPLHDVMGFRKEVNGTTVDISFQWCVDGYSAIMLGYANSIRTIDGGTHIDGVKASITRTFNSLLNKSKLVEDKDVILSEEHVIEGLTCIVSVIVPRPEFEGQTQTRLGNPYVREIVDQSVQEYLTEYFELHPDVFESIISKSFNAYKTDLAVTRARDLYRSESVSTVYTIQPVREKLTNCSSETSEIIIGRGDSSVGAADHGSDRCFKNKRTREQLWSDDAVSTAPGDSSEDSSFSNFEKRSKKRKSSVQSSHLPVSSRQPADDSNPPNPKDVSKKTPKDVTHGSNKIRPVIPVQSSHLPVSSRQPADDSNPPNPKDVSKKTPKDVTHESNKIRPVIPVQASHVRVSSRQSAGDSNPPNPKDVSKKTPKDVTHGSNKTRPVVPVQSSHLCVSSRRSAAGDSNPPNPKYLSKNTPKDVSHGSNKTRPVTPIGPGFQSSHLCVSSRQSAGGSNPPNPKGVTKKTQKDVTHGSIKTRPVIPIGPRFQAEIPVWVAPTKKGKFYGSPGDSDTLRWLGTGVWPTYSLKKTVHYKKVGEGRPDSCSCTNPRSISCIKRHTKEARELLKKEINRAFDTWKFDEMGEEAGSWTAKEEQRFDALLKKNPLSSSDGFWEFAYNAFPRKSEKDLVNYYYNVFLIKRMRFLANSSASHHIDSDDDQYDDFLAG